LWQEAGALAPGGISAAPDRARLVRSPNRISASQAAASPRLVALSAHF